MPEDSKKTDKKNAKEQRKPRQRHQQAKADKKAEKVDEPKSAPKVTVPQKPPVYESPPPEFFKNLKRETDEILKITEEENSKYKKKEIQSNWSKYEVPIESYDEIEEQENMGADYEKLIEAPLSVGGHFQFKHEKSWDINTGPSPYDKYFEINMEDLNTALCTVPFNERNNIEQSLFSETDILTMMNRATRFKQKYFNDKSYSTPEMEAQDKILSSLRGDTKNDEVRTSETDNNDIEIKSDDNDKITPLSDKNSVDADINLEFKTEATSSIVDSNKIIEESTIQVQNTNTEDVKSVTDIVENDDFIFVSTARKSSKCEIDKVETPSVKVAEVEVTPQIEVKKIPPLENKVTPVESKLITAVPLQEAKVATEARVTTAAKVTRPATTVVQTPVEEKKKPVIESPEDLEKWLDDFLDG